MTHYVAVIEDLASPYSESDRAALEEVARMNYPGAEIVYAMGAAEEEFGQLTVRPERQYKAAQYCAEVARHCGAAILLRRNYDSFYQDVLLGMHSRGVNPTIIDAKTKGAA